MALWAIAQRQRYLALYGLARQSQPKQKTLILSAQGGEAPSLGASKRCVLQAFASQMQV